MITLWGILVWSGTDTYENGRLQRNCVTQTILDLTFICQMWLYQDIEQRLQLDMGTVAIAQCLHFATTLGFFSFSWTPTHWRHNYNYYDTLEGCEMIRQPLTTLGFPTSYLPPSGQFMGGDNYTHFFRRGRMTRVQGPQLKSLVESYIIMHRHLPTKKLCGGSADERWLGVGG